MNRDEIKVTIDEYGKKREFICRRGRRLSDLLRSEGISAEYPCGGMGRCGKCRGRFISGNAPVTTSDENFFSAKELSEGARLLCRVVLEEDCEIILERADEPDMSISELADGKGSATESELMTEETFALQGDERIAVAVDLGTTTIAAALVTLNGDDAKVLKTAGCRNHQSAYGADVISRIAASEDADCFAHMRDVVRRDVESLVKELLTGPGILTEPLFIAVAGNTAMLNLFAGESIEGLGKYPYTPAFLDEKRFDSRELFSEIKDSEVILMPGISSFVGADILSGLYHLDILEKESALLADLGTNGEMAFWDGVKLYVTSTAAGPVFEGVGISCGMPSVAGAICHVELDADTHKAVFETIFNEVPRGLCGTGVIETVSELVRTGICDPTGLLPDRYFDEGFPVTEEGTIKITQKDIRNVQLGNADIYSGILTLLGDKIPGNVYIAGGFGTHINPKRIENIRMFPPGFNDKITSSGNTSLKGAIRYAVSCLKGDAFRAEADKELEAIRTAAEVVELSESEGFKDEYFEAMNF